MNCKGGFIPLSLLLSHRYKMMCKCWALEPRGRPHFAKLVAFMGDQLADIEEKVRFKQHTYQTLQLASTQHSIRIRISSHVLLCPFSVLALL